MICYLLQCLSSTTILNDNVFCDAFWWILFTIYLIIVAISRWNFKCCIFEVYSFLNQLSSILLRFNHFSQNRCYSIDQPIYEVIKEDLYLQLDHSIRHLFTSNCWFSLRFNSWIWIIFTNFRRNNFESSVSIILLIVWLNWSFEMQ